MRSIIPTLALAAVPLLFSSIGRAESKPAPQLAPPNAPKSEFNFRPGYAKDPFFPRSTDNVIAPPVAMNPTVAPGTVPEWVALRGLSITGNRRLAIINNRTVGEGEEFTLKLSGGKSVTLRCVEIKEKSVVIALDGVTKELILRIN
ncbi:MAG TPA: hypothetical protein VJS65_08945 [Verrucomicrobiae bacterium]|nr:hypothetical protein [Verrucomicrobiae bacterium]